MRECFGQRQLNSLNTIYIIYNIYSQRGACVQFGLRHTHTRENYERERVQKIDPVPGLAVSVFGQFAMQINLKAQKITVKQVLSIEKVCVCVCLCARVLFKCAIYIFGI